MIIGKKTVFKEFSVNYLYKNLFPLPMDIDRLYKTIDDMDADKFVAFLDENAKFKFGNAPVVQGKEAIKKAVADFFSTIKGISHNLLNTWIIDKSIITQGEATYTRKDDKAVTIPFVNIFSMDNDLIEDYLIYIDINPLFAKE